LPPAGRRDATRPTVYDVAQRAGVSTATVSFAFRQPHRVRPATLELVLEAARVLGYVPSASARGLAGGRTGAIGLYSFDYLLDHRVEPAVPAESAGGDGGYRSFPLYVDEVLHGVELECRRLGYALMVGGGRTSPSLPAVVDVAGRVDGLIALSGSQPAEAITAVARRTPVVVLGTRVDHPRVRAVTVDNVGGMRRLVEHLVGVHRCRRFVFLGELQTVEIEDRYRGFVEAVVAAGLTAPPPTSSYPGLDGTTELALRSFVERAELPDAFVCATDQEALVTLDTLTSVGLSVPGQVVVTGFDGIVAGQLSSPRLTTVRQPMGEIGQVAVRTLVRMLDEDPGPAPSTELPVELVIRASCGCPGPDPR
jgi:DNA-binding LacI/PurR family transcriptional regulator